MAKNIFDSVGSLFDVGSKAVATQQQNLTQEVADVKEGVTQYAEITIVLQAIMAAAAVVSAYSIYHLYVNRKGK